MGDALDWLSAPSRAQRVKYKPSGNLPSLSPGPHSEESGGHGSVWSLQDSRILDAVSSVFLPADATRPLLVLGLGSESQSALSFVVTM